MSWLKLVDFVVVARCSSRGRVQGCEAFLVFDPRYASMIALYTSTMRVTCLFMARRRYLSALSISSISRARKAQKANYKSKTWPIWPILAEFPHQVAPSPCPGSYAPPTPQKSGLHKPEHWASNQLASASPPVHRLYHNFAILRIRL